MTRTQDRRDYGDTIRIGLTERDLDEHDDRFSRLERRQTQIFTVGVSALVSTLLACVLIIVDLARSAP